MLGHVESEALRSDLPLHHTLNKIPLISSLLIQQKPSVLCSPPLLTLTTSEHAAGDMLNPRTLSDFMSKNVDKDLYPAIFMMTPIGVLLAYSTPAHVPTLRHQAALVGDAWEKVVRSLHRPSPSRNISSSRLKSPSSPHARPGHVPRIVSHDLTSSNFNPSVNTVASSLQNGDVDIISLRIGDKNLLVKAVQPSLLIVLVGTSIPKDEPTLGAAHETVGDLRSGIAPIRPPSSQSTHSKSPHPAPSTPSENQPDTVSLTSGHSRDESSGSVIDSTVSGARSGYFSVDLLQIQRRKLERLAEYIKTEFDKDGFVMPYDLSK